MRTEQLPCTLEAWIFDLQAKYENRFNSTYKELNHNRILLLSLLELFFVFGISSEAKVN